MPIIVCHHVYPDDATELLSATDESSTCVPLVDLAGDPETTGRGNGELARKPIGEAWHGAMVRLQGLAPGAPDVLRLEKYLVSQHCLYKP